MSLQVSKATLDWQTLNNAQTQTLTRRGTTYYVDAVSGVDTRLGKSWRKAFLTMAKAFSVITSGDTIVFSGKIKEQLETPAGVFDVAVVGTGNRPRHADTHPTATSGKAAATWTTPDSPTAATPLVRVQQQGWLFDNILFAGPTGVSNSNASIELYRTDEALGSPAGSVERDASHLTVQNCRFASGYKHINDVGGCYGVKIAGNRFVNHTLWAILGVGNIGVGQSNWEIYDNDFDSNAVATANHVKIAGFACRIHDNTFDDGGLPDTTVVLNTNNGGGANNRVYGNHFQTVTGSFNTPDVVGCATDFWNPNYSFDTLETGIPA
jgi:hypothetical protein